MIETQNYKIPKGPRIDIQMLVCDYCGSYEPLDSVTPDKWHKVDDIAGSAGLNAYVFDTVDCMINFYQAATPGE